MSRRKVQILVVEDEVEITRALQRSLTACGYEVLIAHSGEIALQLLDHRMGCRTG
jgi:two-component system KDP operon response regulator KdpE